MSAGGSGRERGGDVRAEGMSVGADAPDAHEARVTAIVKHKRRRCIGCMMSRAGPRRP